MNVKMRRGVTWQDRDEVVVFKDAYSQPFLQKMGVITSVEFDALYEQMLTNLQAEDFCGLLSLLTLYGEKS